MPKCETFYYIKRCIYCGLESALGYTAKMCKTCRPFVGKAAGAAIAKTNAAIKRGQLPNPNTLKCQDCNGPAHLYDHRDYDQPLLVEPVCRSCNCYRGPSKIPNRLAEAIANYRQSINSV